MAKKESKSKNLPAVAKETNGNVQITFDIDWNEIETKKLESLEEYARNIEVSGFRKGKAPISEVLKKVPAEQLTERTLSKILPNLFSDLIHRENLRPAIYPKFELISAKDGENWQVRATTCELPEIDVKDYKEVVSKVKTTKKQNHDEKENTIMEALLAKYNTEIPEMLIDEEVNSRLASLLERLEKLGLSLESYLASLKKTAPELRNEYGEQAKKAIVLDIVLQNIAIKEDVKVSEKDIADYLMAATNGQDVSSFSESQKNTIRLFLMKRETLHSLLKLVK